MSRQPSPTFQVLRQNRLWISRFLAVFMALWQIGQPLQAADLYWDNDGTATGNNVIGTNLGLSGTWNTSSLNWWDAANPLIAWPNLSADTAIFKGTAGRVTLGSSVNAGTLQFDAANYTINNSAFALTLQGGITANESATIQSGVGGSLILGANNAWNVAGTKTLTVSSLVSDGASSFSIDKLGAGALTLSGANTFDSGVTLTAGTLNIGNASALGTGTFAINGGTIDNTSGAALTLASNNVQTWGSDFTFTGTSNLNLGTGAVTLGANRQVTVNANTLTVGGVIDDGASSFSLTKAGAGSLTLAGANTFGGGVTLDAGTLNIANASALGAGTLDINGGTVNNTSGAALTLSGNNAQNWDGNFTFTGTSSLDLGTGAVTLGANRQVTVTGNTLTVGGVIDDGPGSFSLTKLGVGTLVLSGANTYEGGTFINAGTVLVNHASALGSAGDIDFGGGTLQYAAGVTTDFSARIRNSASAIAINTSQQIVTFAGAIDSSNSGGLTKTGNGTLRLSNSGNGYTGTTTVSKGALVVGSNGALGGATTAVSVTGSPTFGTGGGQLLVGGSYGSGVTISRDLSLSGGGTWGDGAALLTVGNNTLSGGITTSAANTNRLFSSFGITTLSNSLSIGAGRTTQIGGSGNFNLTGTFTMPNTTATLLEKVGTGTLIFAPSSTTLAAQTGNELRASAGFIRLSSGTPFVATGPALSMNDGGLEIRTDSGSSFSNAILNLRGNGTVLADHAVGTLWTSGAPNINNTVTFGVTSVLTANRTATFNGRNGTNVVLSPNGLGNITLASGNPTTFTNNLQGGTLTLNGNLTFNEATNARAITVGGNADSIVSGNLLLTGGPQSFSKAGTGRLMLNGTASTYTGNTTVVGTLSMGNLGAINGASTTGSVLLNTGALEYTGAAASLAKPFSLLSATANNAILSNGSGALTLSGNVGSGGIGAKTLFLGGGTASGDNTFSGLLLDNTSASTTGLAKIGSGTWVLTAPTTGAYGANATKTLAAPGTTATSTLTLDSTTGLSVGMALAGTTAATTPFITSILDATRVTVSVALTTTTAPAGSYTFNAIPTASTATVGGTWSGPLVIANGTLKLSATTATSNIVQNTNAVSFNVDAFTGNQSAGGTLNYINNVSSAGAISETLGTLTPSAGMGKIVVTPNGQPTTLTLTGMGTRVAGSQLDFTPSSGGTGGAVTFTNAVTGNPNGIVGGYATTNTSLSDATTPGVAGSTTVSVTSTTGLRPGMVMTGGSAPATIVSITNGTDFVVSAAQTFAAATPLTFTGRDFAATIGAGGSVVAPTYTAGGPLFNSTPPGTVGSATVNYLSNGNTLTTGNYAANSLRIVNNGTNGTFSGTGVLTITSASATSLGGILFDNSLGAGGISGFTGIASSTTNQELIFNVGGSTPANAFTVASRLTNGSGSFTKGGSGKMILSSTANTYTGSTIINEGTLQLSGSTTTLGGTLAAGSVLALRQGAVLDLNAAGASGAISGGPAQPSVVVGALNGAGTIRNSGGGSAAESVLVIGNSATTVASAVFSGLIEDNGGKMNVTLVRNAAAQLQYLTGDNTYTGVTTLTQGILSVFKLANGGLASGIGASTSSADNLVFNGGILRYTGSDAVALQMTQTPSVSTDRLFTLTNLGGTIDSSGSSGNSVLTAIVAATQNNAALVFGNTGDVAFTGSGNRTFTLQGTSTGDNQFNPRLIDPASQVSPALTGTLALTKAGAGLWILNPTTSNSYTGTTAISGGALQVAAEGAAVQGLSAGSLLTLNGGVLQTSGNFTRTLGAVAGNVQLTGGTSGFSASSSKLTVTLGGGAITWGGATFNPASLVLGSTTALAEVEFANDLVFGAAPRTIFVEDNTTTSTDFAVVSGKISGSAGGNLLKTGSGNLVLTNLTSDYVGNTQISAGTLTLQAIDGAGGTSNLGTNAGTLLIGNATTTAGTLVYVGAGETVNRTINLNTTTAANTIDSSGSGALILNAATMGGVTGNKGLTLTGVNTDFNEIKSNITAMGSGALSKTGSGTWIVSGLNTFTGGVTMSGGALGIGADSTGAVTSGPLGTGALTFNGNGSGIIFAANADRNLGNNLTIATQANTTSPVVFFTGDYSLALGSASTAVISTSGANQLITNNIAAGKTLTLGGTVGGGSVFNLQDTTNPRTLTIAGSGATVINALIQNGGSAAGGLTLNAPGGSLTLNGANTYTGTTTVTAGTLNFGSVANLGAGNLTMSGGTLQWRTGTTTDISSKTVTFATATSTYDTNGNDVTLANSIGNAGAFGMTKTGAGTLYLQGANNFTGTVTINSGVVKIDNELNLGVVANDVTFGAGGGTLQVTNGFTADVGKVISVQAGPGTIQVDSGTLTLGSAIVGTAAATANGGGLIKTGAGTLALTVSSGSYDAQGVGLGGATGVGFRVDAGTLLLQGTSNSVVGDIIPTSMTMQLNGGNLSMQTDTASIARANLWVSSNATLTTDRATAGGDLTQAIGTGTGAQLTIGNTTPGSPITLNVAGGSNFTSGTATVSFGATTLNAPVTFNITNPASATTLLSLGAVTTSTANAITLTGNGNFAGTGIVGGTGTVNLGVAGVVSAYSGTATLSGVNTFTGGLFINSGTASATTSTSALGGATGRVWLGDRSGSNNATLLGDTRTYANPITVQAGSSGNTLTIGNSGSTSTVFSGPVALNNALTLAAGGTGSVNLSGQVTGSGTITTTGASGNTVFMGGSNGTSFTGAVNVASGTLKLNSATALGDTVTGTTVTSGATLDLNNFSSAENVSLSGTGVGGLGALISSNASGGTLSGTATLSTASSIGGANPLTISGTVTGAGDLTKVGAGTTTLSGTTIDYTGATNVSAGTLSITGSSGAAITTSALTIAGGATLNTINTVGQRVNLAGAINLGAGSGTTVLGLELGTTVGNAYDSFNSAVAATTTGAVQFNITNVGMVTGTYNLLQAISGLGGATYTFGSLPGGYTYTSATSSTSVDLTVVAALNSLFWQNSQADGKWNTQTAIMGGLSNWSTDLPGLVNASGIPGSNSVVTFSSQAGIVGSPTTATTLETPFSIDSLVFNNETNGGAITAVTIAPGAAGTLTMAPAFSSNGINVQTGAPASIGISAPVILGGAQTWTVADAATSLTSSSTLNMGANALTLAGAGTKTISGLISGTVTPGTVGLTITGGTVNLTNNSNSFTGDIDLSGGTLVYSGSAATTTLSQLGRGSATDFKQVLISNGATFRVANSWNVNVNTATNLAAGAVFNIGTGGGTFDVASSQTFTVDDGTTIGTSLTAYQLQGSGNLTKSGLGTLVLRSQNSYSGTITVSGGLLQSSGTTIASGSAGITIQSGAALSLSTLVADTQTVTISGTGLAAAPAGAITNNTGTASYAGNVTLAANSSIGGPGTALTLSGIVSDASGGFNLTKVGVNTTTLSNTANTYSGALSINGGTLSVASLANTGTGSNGTGAIVFNNAAAAAVLTYTGSGSGTMAGRGISLQGSGGAVTINSNGTGALSFNGSNTIGITGNTALTLGGSYVGSSNVMAGDLADNGASVLSLTKTGAGTWTLSGNNSFTGNVGIGTGNPGALIITNSSALGVGPKTISVIDNTAGNSASIQLDGSGGNINLASNLSWTTSSVNGTGGILNLVGDNTINGNFTLTGGGGSTQFTVSGGTLTIGSGATLTPNTTGRFLVLNGDAATSGYMNGLMQNGAGANTLGLQKLGAGEWLVSNANTFTAGTQVQQGNLRLVGGNNRLLSSGGAVVLGNGVNSGKLVIGGNADGTTTAGSQRIQQLNQTTATSILSVSGTGTTNSVIGGADGGTSAGTPANNSLLNLNIGAGFTDTYAGLIGWDGTGSVGFQNNINLQKSGGGTLVLSADLSNWTGTVAGAGPNLTNLAGDGTRPELQLTGGVLRLTNTAVINTVIRNTGGVIDDLGATYGNNYFLVVSGGLISLSQTGDSFSNSGLTASSHGVGALNIPGNTGVVDFAGSDMYLGAVGARVYSNSPLAAGSGSTYRFGGGAPWNALGSAAVNGSGGNLRVSIANVVTGTNKVIIGDNGSYNSGSGLFGGNSTVAFTAAQNYDGTTTLAGGSLIVSNINQLGTLSATPTAGSIILDGGIFRYSGITTDISNRLTIDSGGTIDTNGQNVTFASAIGNSDTGTSDGTSHPATDALGGLTKIGAGTLTLSTANKTYAGTTTVGGGILQLNRQTASLAATSGLTFGGGGGTFRLDNTGATGILSQTMGALSFTAGDGVILSQRTAAQSTNLTFASITARTAGATGNFTVGGTGATAAINQVILTSVPTLTNQFLNAGLYFGGTDFAVYDAAGAGFVRAINYATDTNVANSAGGSTLGAVVGNDVQLGTAAVTAQTTLAVNSLKINGAFGITMGAGQTLTISSGGLIKTGATATITGGTLSTSGAELVVRQSASTDALNISSSITASGLTKSGAGTLTLATGTNTFGNQPITINGGTISVDSESRFGAAGTDYSSIVLNGGNLTITGNSTVNGPFALGLGGGTITQSNGSNDNNIGVAGVNLAMPGLGARTLTLVGADSRSKNFRFNIGDNGGPSSLVVAGGGDANVITLTGNNTYTGTTTITRGVLRLSSTGALPGGLGGTTLTSSNSGGGNLIFAATGALPTNNRAVLELNATSGDFYRAVGTGFDQVSWTGHGGFSVSDTSTRIVNLGGAAAQVTWASGGFVPTGSALQFGQSATNVGFTGTIDFQNAVDLTGAARTVDVANGTQVVDAIMSGNITGTSDSGGLIKQGLGVLRLNGTNNSGALTVNVTGGNLYFEDSNAVLGASGNITVTGGLTSIGVGGSTNPLSVIGSRIVTSSNGGIALDTNSSATLDFSTFTALRLTAFNPANAVTYFSGTINPNSNTYRFGGQQFTLGTNSSVTTLAFPVQNTLTGARSVDLAPGNLTILQSQNYSGGTVVNTVLAGGTSTVGVGSDAAFGPGTITVGGANTVSFGAVNGDRVIPNRIINSQTAAVAFVVGGDLASDGISTNAAQGALTYTGEFDLNSRAASAVLFSRTGHAALFLGNILNSSNGITLNSTTSGLFSILSTAPNGGVTKGYSGTTILGDNTTLVIDVDGSLGTSGNIAFNTSRLRLQPGGGAVTLASGRSISITADDSQTIQVGGGGILTIAGVIGAQGTNTAIRTFNKVGAGTLIINNKNAYTGAATFSPTLVVQGGLLQLDSLGTNFTAVTDRFFPDASNPLPLTLGAASATFAGGGTLEIIQRSGNAFDLTQGFGNLTINQGAQSIKLSNNATAQALTFNLGSTFTRLAGGTLDFSSTTAGGTNAIGSSVANQSTLSILGGAYTFTNSTGVNWATQSGSNTITPLASYTAVLPASGAVATTNYLVTTSPSPVTAAQSIGSLKFAPASATQTITLNAGATITNTSLGLLFDNTNGSGTITSGATTGQFGATSSEVIVHTAGTGSVTANKLTLNGVIKGSATSLTKSGSGTLVLAGANSYTGALTINAGAVEYSSATVASSAGQLGNPTANAANIILNGGTFRYTGTTANNLPFGITVNGFSTIDVPNAAGVINQNATGLANMTGIASVAGLVQKTGVGALTLGGDTANASMSIQLAGGTLNLAKTANVLALGESTNASGIPYAALIVNTGSTARITGVGTDQIGNASSVLVQGTGVFDVNGSGSTSVAESIDGLAGNGLIRNLGASAFTLTLGANNSSGISAYTVGAAQAASLVGDNNINARGLNHFAGVIQDNIALTKIGSGTQILSGANTYTGVTTISAGTLKLGAANVLPSGSGKGNVQIIGNNTGVNVGGAANIVAPGTLDMGGFDQAINGLDSTTGGFVTSNPTAGANITNTLTVGRGDASGAFNGVITNGYSVGANSTTATPLAYVGTINFTKTGTGTQVLSGANTYSGKTTIENGALSVASINSVTGGSSSSNLGAPTTVGNGTLDFGSGIETGRLLYTGAGETTDRVVNLAGTTGGGTIDHSGTGVLKFTSNTTATGVGSKTLILQGSTAGTGEMSGNIVNGSGTSALTKAGTGTWILTGTNSYTGATEVSNGTLQLGNGSTTGDIAGTSGVNLSSSTAILKSNRSDTLTISQAITGSGKMEVANTSTGITVLTNNTTSYSGTTTVSGGTLQVGDGTSGSLTGSGNVNVTGVGTKLSGSGSIAGSVILGTGAILAPGTGNNTDTSNRTLTFTGAGTAVEVQDGAQIQLGLSSSSKIDLGFNWVANDAKTYLDSLTVNGTDFTSNLSYTTNWKNAESTYDSIKLTGGTFNLGQTAGGTVKLIDNSAGYSLGNIFKLLDWSTLGSTNSLLAGSGGFDISYLNLDSVLPGSGLSWDTSAFSTYGVIVVVPEPSRALLMLLGLLALGFRRRRIQD